MGKEPSLDEWGREKQEWRDTVDIAENVIIMYGFEGHFWKQEQRWTILNYNFDTDEQEETKQVEEQANKVRSLIQGNIPPFFERIKKTTTGQEAATQFYHFLLENGIEKQLMMWRNEAVANGQLELAKNHEQTWQALMTLLDEYVTIYGEEYFCLDNFMTIFSSGLEGLRYNKVPTAIDQVQIRTLDLASPGQAKIVFAVGLTNQVLPQKYDNQTLLSDEERVVVNERLDEGQFLLKNTQKSIAKEPFLAYLLFSSAQERIYLSYPQIKDGIKDLSPSPYLSIIQKGLKINVQVKRALTITDGEEDSLRYIGTYRTLISELTALKRQEKEMQGVLSPFWLAMEKELLRQPLALKARQVFSSLTHKNVPENLSEKLADQLYGKEIYTSVSRMESFHRCQYQYFSHFGLKLQERERFGLTAAATGDFFHEALDVFFKLLRDQKQSLINLTNDELGKVTDETLRMLFADAKFFILNSSSRMNYIRYQLSQTIKKMSWVLKKQSQRSGLTPLQTEVLFGQLATQKGLKGLDLALDTGGQIHVRGKIDRIDQLVTNEAVYLGVIDYKSSHKNFSLTEAYHGLAMQMLTYLDVVLADASTLIGQPAKPAGSLYMHVHNPVLPYSRLEDKEQLLVKQFKFDGLLVNDTSLLEALDTQIEAKQTSPLYPIEESAKEVVKPGRRQEDKFVTHEELQGLLKNNRRKFVEAGNQMTQGSISLNPAYQGKERIACRFCAYRSVCTFDVMLQENQYHRIEHLTKKEIMDQLLKKENRGGQDE